MDKFDRVRALVHSQNQPIRVALRSLCQRSKNEVICTDNIDVFLKYLSKCTPEYLVMDVPAREYAWLIYDIRASHPTLPIVLVQKEFFFSDRAVAEYFGSVILKEYDALLSIWPAMTPADIIYNPSFCGPEFYFKDRSSQNGNFLSDIQCWMKKRLEGIISSRRAREVALNWLAKGISPDRVSQNLERSDKVVYFYRSLVMRHLNIKRTRDFVAALNIKH